MEIRYFNNKKVGIVFLFLVFFLAACSTSHRAVDSKSTIIPKELYPKPTVQRPKEGALWPGDTRGNYLFGDDKAAKVGDIITVTINENATSTATATTETEKSNTMNMAAPNILGLPSNMGVGNFLGMGTQLDPTVNATIAN